MKLYVSMKRNDKKNRRRDYRATPITGGRIFRLQRWNNESDLN